MRWQSWGRKKKNPHSSLPLPPKKSKKQKTKPNTHTTNQNWKHTSIAMNNNKPRKFVIPKPTKNSQNQNPNPYKIHNTQTNHGSDQIWLTSHIYSHTTTITTTRAATKIANKEWGLRERGTNGWSERKIEEREWWILLLMAKINLSNKIEEKRREE